MAHEEHKEKVSTMRAETGYNATYLRHLPENAKHITPSVKSGTEVLAYVQKMWRRAIIHVPKSDKGEEFRDFYTIIYSQRSGNVSTSRATPKKGKTVLTVSFDPTYTRYDPHAHTKWSRKGLVKEETYEDGAKVWVDSGIFTLPKKERLMV